MQISGHGGAQELARLLLGVQEVERPVQPGASPAQPREDQVRISADAKEILRIKGMTDEGDAARAERLERIRRAVDGGTYDVHGRTVADSLIRHVLTDAVL
ncbi:flagellar biosynthesis anti-sigma factor FlgM [Candidatus Nitrospira bockiana]